MPRKTKPKQGRVSAEFVPDLTLSADKCRWLAQCVALEPLKDNKQFISALESALGDYAALAEQDRTRPKIREMKAALSDLETKISDLAGAVATLDSETNDLIAHAWVKAGGEPNQLGIPMEPLRLMINAVSLAERELEGRTKQPQLASRFLTGRIADILDQFHIPLTDYESGPFNTCLSVLTNEKSSTTRNWIRWHLKKTQVA